MPTENLKIQVNQKNIESLRTKYQVSTDGICTEAIEDIKLDLLPFQDVEFSQDPRDHIVVAKLPNRAIALCQLFTTESLEVDSDFFNIKSTTYIGDLDLNFHLLYQGQSELNSYFIYRDEDSIAPISGTMGKNGRMYESFHPSQENMIDELGQMIDFDIENIYVSTLVDDQQALDEDTDEREPIAAILITLK